MSNDLIISVDGRGVAFVSLNRPGKHNAFDDKLIGQLTELFQALNRDPEVRVVVLTGMGKSFSSGADLNWMKSMVDYDEDTNLQDSLRLANLMETLFTFSKPTIARVNGPAYGGALGLIACCDIAIGTDHADFCFSEVKFGIAPAVISPYVITAIGYRHAKKLFLTGELFSAREALHIGLLHECVHLDDLQQSVNKHINLLLRGAPNAQSEIKTLLSDLSGFDSTIKTKTAALIAKLRNSEEGQNGINAFLNKTKPRWLDPESE